MAGAGAVRTSPLPLPPSGPLQLPARGPGAETARKSPWRPPEGAGGGGGAGWPREPGPATEGADRGAAVPGPAAARPPPAPASRPSPAGVSRSSSRQPRGGAGRAPKAGAAAGCCCCCVASAAAAGPSGWAPPPSVSGRPGSRPPPDGSERSHCGARRPPGAAHRPCQPRACASARLAAPAGQPHASGSTGGHRRSPAAARGGGAGEGQGAATAGGRARLCRRGSKAVARPCRRSRSPSSCQKPGP